MWDDGVWECEEGSKEGSLEAYLYIMLEVLFEDGGRGVEAVGVHCARGKRSWKGQLADRMEFRLPRLICLQSHYPSSEKLSLREKIWYLLDEKYYCCP